MRDHASKYAPSSGDFMSFAMATISPTSAPSSTYSKAHSANWFCSGVAKRSSARGAAAPDA
jgi:hypothetical protein